LRSRTCCEDLLQRVAAVPQQVPSVRDLRGVRRPGPDAVGVGPGAVAGDDLDAGAGAQPGRERGRLAVGQQVDDAPRLEVDQGRAVSLAAPPGPVTDPEHPRRRGGRRGRALHQAEQGIAAGRHAEALGEARAGTAAEGEADLALDAAQPVRPPRPGPGHLGQAFGEDPARAGRRDAAEPPCPEHDRGSASLPGQVGQAAAVVATDPPRGQAAERADGRRRSRRGEDDDSVGFGQHLQHQQACRDQRQEAAGQLGSERSGSVPPRCALARLPATTCTKSAEEPRRCRGPPAGGGHRGAR
jgi:hypothetical protein